jgi:hypothetical protein
VVEVKVIRWFGHQYLSPMYQDAPEVPTPVGEPCQHCQEEIGPDDDGIVVDGACTALGSIYHRACFMWTVIGSVAHIEKRCSCFVPGSTDCDPPGLTKREAAELALTRFYEETPE